ncbi:MAG: hypothetical protein KBD37_01170 [Burkholderiales bacterium]|nr:hypothetical protein [Burkholderiales bacterium]
MKISKSLAKWCSLSIACLILSACNSGSGGTSTSTPSTSSSSAYTLPSGVTVLPNGAQISVLNSALGGRSGKNITTKLQVRGGSSSVPLNLSAEITDMQSLASSNSGLVINFDHNAVTTGTPLSTSEITIDAANATPGNYRINIIANNLNAMSSNTAAATNLTAINHVQPINYTSTSDSATVASIDVAVSSTDMLKATYLDITDTSTLSSITASGYASSNMILFAFLPVTTNEINNSYLEAMQTAITENSSASTLWFVSLGGALNADPSTFNTTTAPTIISNVTAQINAYNAQLMGGQITGVDLDLENNISESTITMLAQGFKEAGFLISTAPQVVPLTGTSVDPLNPTNLGLSSGGYNNQYGVAIANGYVDYILAQTYNTGGWTVGGFSESEVGFFSPIAQALNNTVHSNCSNSINLCIPLGTQIALGEVSNGGSAGTIYNLFGSNGSTYYNQSSILSQLNDQITPVLTNYTNVDGVMQWSYNGDYSPTSWGDYYATPGAFTSTIFGAESVVPIPAFILQVTNTTSTGGTYPYGSATLVINGQYMVYGTSNNTPISPLYLTSNNYQQWGTSTSSSNSSGTVAYSSNFNTLFSNGATSFTTSQILINAYPQSTSAIGSPSAQYNCSSGANYTFYAGYKYNVMVNPVYQSCAISLVGPI